MTIAYRPDADSMPPGSTRSAEGLRRRAFTVVEIEAMVKAGIISEDEHFELIGGEAVPMNAKGIFHERMKQWLMMQFARQVPDGISFIPETTFRLDDYTFLEPDFVFYEDRVGLEGLTGETALLCVEIADSSLSYDLGMKAQLYAAFGIAELWVIHVADGVTTIHREPTVTGYRQVRDIDPKGRLSALNLGDLTVRLADFG